MNQPPRRRRTRTARPAPLSFGAGVGVGVGVGVLGLLLVGGAVLVAGAQREPRDPLPFYRPRILPPAPPPPPPAPPPAPPAPPAELQRLVRVWRYRVERGEASASQAPGAIIDALLQAMRRQEPLPVASAAPPFDWP